jgi:hypothetical protein
MDPIFKRFSLRITRGWALLILVIGLLLAGSFWVGPLRSPPAELQLLALGANGAYAQAVTVDRNDALPSNTPGREVRFPLALGLRNVGARGTTPHALHLSVPARFQVTGAHARVPASYSAGNPLVRYQLDVAAREIAPGEPPVPLEPVDTIWLEPALPTYYCTFLADDIPDFIPAPAYDPELISRVEIFYSFRAESSARQTGLLTVHVDPRLLRTEAAPVPPAYPVTLQEPEAPRPELGAIYRVGSRREQCGEPDQAVELHTVLWETENGGRFFVVYHGGAPRKYLFDLDRDDFIELEMWDPDSDGRFEARRQARFRTPGFLLPILPPAARLSGGTVVPDSAWLRNFYDTAAGPFRFLRGVRDTSGIPGGRGQRPDTLVRGATAPPRGAAADTIRRDTLERISR